MFVGSTMGDRLRVAIFDPDGQGSGPLEAALVARRCDVSVVRVAAGLLVAHALDLVVVGGDAAARSALCDLLIPTGVASRPFLVALVPSYEDGDVEPALAVGVDDVLVATDVSRLGPLLRHASRYRRAEREIAAPQGLIEHVSDFVLQLDRNAMITFMNRDGPVKTVSESVGSSAYEHLPAEWQPKFTKAFEAALETGQPRVYETASYGRIFRVRIVPTARDGEITGATLLAADVTELSSVVRKLRESESHAEAILDALPDLVVRVRDDGVLLDVHAPPRPQSSDLPSRSDVGKSLFRLVPVAVGEKLVDGIRRSGVSSDLEVVTYEIGEGNERRDFEARIVASEAGQAIMVVRDMTEHNRSRERSTVTERLASLGTMAAGVAHELNSPLTFVMLGLEWIARMLGTVEPGVAIPKVAHHAIAERLREVLDGAQRIRRIVRDLKGFTRPEETKLSLVDVPSAIDGALSLAAAELRYRATVDKRYGELPPVLGNHARVGQVVLNLLVNAAHALAEDRAAENVVTIAAFHRDAQVLIEISDNGTGIPQHHLSRLFEPFFTTKPVGQGTGLGLWVCHEIVKELGGEITVESELGKGSTFRVALPVGEPRSTHPPDLRESTAPLPRARILIVDDEPNLARTLARLLDGHTVEVAGGGDLALELFARDSEFDLVLCDLMMPGRTGMDVHAEVTKTWPFLADRFVFMTGGAFTHRAKTFLAEVGLPYLEKPFRYEAVLEILKKMREK